MLVMQTTGLLQIDREIRLPPSVIIKSVFKRDVNGKWRRLHNEELHSLYRSPKIVKVIKSRRLRWAGHVSRMEESRSAFKILTGKPVETFREA